MYFFSTMKHIQCPSYYKNHIEPYENAKKRRSQGAYWCSTEAFILEFGVQVLAYRRRAGPGCWEFLAIFWFYMVFIWFYMVYVSQLLVVPIVDGPHEKASSLNMCMMGKIS